MMSKRLVVCCKEISPEKCVQYQGTACNQTLKNMTLEENDMGRLQLQVDDLRELLFATTEALTLAILLVFILVIVLAWRINRNNTTSRRRITQQTFMNRAYQPDDETDYGVCNMIHTYSEHDKLPMELKH